MDLYNTLGVDKDATPQDIKKAYRERAKDCHPDTENGDEEMFKRISEAYEVLSDPKRRAHYDETGEYKKTEGFEEMFKGFVAQVIMPVIESGKSADCNLFKKIFEVISEVKNTGEFKLEESKLSKANIEDAIQRMKKKDDGEDLMMDVMNGRLRYWSEMIERLEGELEFLEKCKSELGNYDYEFTKKSNSIQIDLERVHDRTRVFIDTWGK